MRSVFACVGLLLCVAAGHAAQGDVGLQVADDGTIQSLTYGQREVLLRPVEVQLVEAKDGKRVVGRLTEASDDGRERRFHSESAQLSWETGQTLTDALAWRFCLANHADERRGINLIVTFTLAGAEWEALFAGMNDRPEWPDHGTLRYVYIRSQDTSDNHLANWNAYTYLTIPFACLYDADRDVGVSFVGEDLDFPYYTVYFEAKKGKDGVELTITHPRLRLEAGGERSVTLYVTAHAGDWRAGLGWMRERWKDAFDVPDYAWKMHTTRYTGCSGAGSDRERVSLTDGWWHNRLKKWRWKDTGMVQSRGFDMWYGMWAPDREPWHVNMGHKYRNMIERPGDFPKEIIEKKPDTTSPWREQLAFVEKLGFKFSPSQRSVVNSVASLYPQWETYTHDDVHALVKRVHSMGWYAISHYDLGAAWAPWLRSEFPESSYPGTFFYKAPIWSMPDPFPGSRWRAHIIGQVRQLFEIWPDYDGIMLDQMYYEGERATAEDGTPVDDGITVADDGSVASNLIRNNSSTLAEIKKIMRGKDKVIWGNHARTYFCMTRHCDMLVTEGTATPGTSEDAGKWMTIGSRGCHGLHASELGNQNCLIRGWTAQTYVMSGRSVHAARRDDWEFFSYPYYSLMEMLPGTRWVLTPHALELPEGMMGNIFRRPDGNVLVVAASYGTSVSAPWWRSDVQVKVRLEDAGDVKAAYLVAASHLGPKKLSFERKRDEIAVTIPRHRSVSMVVLAKSGRFLALDERNIGVVKERANEMTVHVDNWTDMPWDWKGELLGGARGGSDDFLLAGAKLVDEEGGGVVFDGSDAFAESPALSFGRDERKTINLWFRTDKGGTFLDVGFVKNGANFFEFLPSIREDDGRLQTWAYSLIGGKRKDLNITAEVDVRDGKWHMYTFTWEGGETIKARAFLDGKPVQPETMSDTLDLGALPWKADQTQGNTIGRGRTYWHDSYRIYKYFNGAIDEVAVFDEALSDIQVRALFARGRQLKADTLAPSPCHLWSFDTANDSGASPAWAAGRTPRESRSLAVSVPVQSSRTVAFEIVPNEENTVHGFTRFTLKHDLGVILPKADALPGNESTFEAIVETPIALSLAPSEELVERSMSNGPPFHKGGRFIKWAQPLSLNESERATFHLMVAHHGAERALVQLSAAGGNVFVEQVPGAVELSANDSLSIPVRVRGATAGDGKITVTATTSDAQETTASLPVRIVATSLSAKDLAAMRSVRMIFDSWYSPGAVGAKIALNGVEVGELPGNGTYGNWTVRQPFALAENAPQALATMNTLVIKTSGRHFKMRNVALEVTLEDGRVAMLDADPRRPQSVPADWAAAEGIRLESGKDMVWNIPIGK